MNLPTLTGLSGINAAMDKLRKDAHDIATAVAKGDEDTSDLAKSLVDLNVNARAAEASVKVVQAIDGVIGTLLDVKA